METEIAMRKAFSIIKIVIAIIATFFVVAGVYNNSLNINVLFLLAFCTFLLTLIETYFSKGTDVSFIVDTMLAIAFLLAFFLF